MRLELLVLLAAILLLFGCFNSDAPKTTSDGLEILPSGEINCKSNLSCIERAFKTNCVDAHFEMLVTSGGSGIAFGTKRVISVKDQGSFCQYDHTDYVNNRESELWTHKFVIPLQQCSVSDAYKLLDGRCAFREAPKSFE